MVKKKQADPYFVGFLFLHICVFPRISDNLAQNFPRGSKRLITGLIQVAVSNVLYPGNG